MNQNTPSAPPVVVWLLGGMVFLLALLALWIGFDGLVRAREIALLDSNVTLGSPSYLLSIGGFWRAIEPLREP